MAGAITVAAVMRGLERQRLYLQRARGIQPPMKCPEPCCNRPPKHRDTFKYHVCCWLLKLALVAPLIHIALHVLALFGINIPHSETIGLIP